MAGMARLGMARYSTQQLGTTSISVASGDCVALPNKGRQAAPAALEGGGKGSAQAVSPVRLLCVIPPRRCVF